MKPPNVSAYAVTTHCRLVSLKCRSRPIVGSETLTIVRSIIVMKNDTASSANARQRLIFGMWTSSDLHWSVGKGQLPSYVPLSPIAGTSAAVPVEIRSLREIQRSRPTPPTTDTDGGVPTTSPSTEVEAEPVCTPPRFSAQDSRAATSATSPPAAPTNPNTACAPPLWAIAPPTEEPIVEPASDAVLVSDKVDQDTFQRALDGLLVARTDAEFASVVRSLPPPVEFTPASRRCQEPVEISTSMGDVRLEGRWQVGRLTKISTGVGSAMVGLTEAEFDDWDVEIVVEVHMGQIAVIAPRGLDVRQVGTSGAISSALGQPIPGFPVVRLSASCDVGTIRLMHPKEKTTPRRRMAPVAQQILTSTLRPTLTRVHAQGRARPDLARPMALSLNQSTRSLGPRASRSPSHSLSLAPTAAQSERRPSAGLRSPAPTSPKQRSQSGRQIHQTSPSPSRSPKPWRTPSSEPGAKGAPSDPSHGKRKSPDVGLRWCHRAVLVA